MGRARSIVKSDGQLILKWLNKVISVVFNFALGLCFMVSSYCFVCWDRVGLRWFACKSSQFNTIALGNKSGSFCEAVNCERSEQEGKFLFAMLVTISWFPFAMLVFIL